MSHKILERIPTTTGNTQKFTFSCWVRQMAAGGTSDDQDFLSGSWNNTYYNFHLGFMTDGRIQIYDWGSSGGGAWGVATTSYYRDNSSWYHILLAVDSTQSVASDRLKLYVNGTRITSFTNPNSWNAGQNGFPSQNYVFPINNAGYPMQIGATVGVSSGTSAKPLNGNITDVYHIDGAVLDPSYFTKTDSRKNGQLVPKHSAAVITAITSSPGFGTNGFYLPLNGTRVSTYTPSTTGLVAYYPGSGSSSSLTDNTGNYTSGGGTYVYGTSFLNGSYCQITSSASMSLTTLPRSNTMTFSGWIYRRTSAYVGFGRRSGNSAYNGQYHVRVAPDGVGGGRSQIAYNYPNTRSYYIPDEWHHYVTTYDSSRGASAWQTFRDGALVVSAADTDSQFANLGSVLYGFNNEIVDNAEIIFSDLRVYSRVLTNQEILDMAQSQSIGIDMSGRNNHFVGSSSDLGTASQTLISSNTATNNFAVMNLNSGFDGTIYKSGLIQSGMNDCLASHGFKTGKYYWEHKILSYPGGGVVLHFGFKNIDYNAGASVINGAAGFVYRNDGNIYRNAGNSCSSWSGSDVTGGTSCTVGDIVGIAVDLTTSPASITVYKNGVSIYNYTFTYTQTPYYIIPYVRNNSPSSSEQNFGQGTFVTSNSGNGYTDINGKGKFQYAPPSGFLALCEDNLPDVSINPKSNFKAITWTGNGASSRAITGLGFKPDFVWAKARDSSVQHMLIDSVRGPNRVLHSNSTGTEDVNFTYGYLTSFDTDGFTMQSGSTSIENLNQNGVNYVAWCWKGSNTTTTNTSGTITSTVSVNQEAGFSVVKYTGNGSSSGTVGHGLGATPRFILLKAIDQPYYWRVYHTIFGAPSPTQGLLMGPADGTGNVAAYNHDSAGGIGSVNSNTFGFASSSWGGQAVNSGGSYIAYCWTDIPGYSKMGYYTYSNSTNGTYVYTGFKPAFIIIKNTDNVEQWYMVDNARNTYNGGQTAFMQASATTESSANTQATNSQIDFLSNGFKLRDLGSASAGEVTYGTRTYAYMAFAEVPFDFANAV